MKIRTRQLLFQGKKVP